ncbi:LacI family DNA-binding transcriptional regulator [Novosphingobium rosa]|uniref:LacI family DNA-binding transcriptional regulator n=1 Tax=Novosphingobium rosa TaxID=76978 RepID=UPI00082A03A1|nr:LacI family DNA-binding transcriptional regulator [Novosphingobium rosa]
MAPIRPTIIDIAQHAGVSFKTVSRVLNNHPKVGEEYRRKVEASMEALNFKPNRAAQLLRGGKSFVLGLLVSYGQYIQQLDETNRLASYTTDVMTGMMQACQTKSYHLVVENIDSSDPEAGLAWLANCMDDVSFDGLVLMPPLCDLPWMLDALEAAGVNFARMNPGTQLGRGICMVIDNYSAGQRIGDLLLGHGHRHIGYISGPPEHQAHTPRKLGLLDAAAEIPTARVDVVPGDFTFATGLARARDLLTRDPRPTAIFAANDEMAAGVLAAAMELGMAVPQDLSIVGFGGLLISQTTWPRITTVHQPTIRMARMAADELIAGFGKPVEEIGRVIEIDFELKQRQSVADPAG